MRKPSCCVLHPVSLKSKGHTHVKTDTAAESCDCFYIHVCACVHVCDIYLEMAKDFNFVRTVRYIPAF